MNPFEAFHNITTFVFDVDGVLTDGSLLLLPGGAMARRMNIKDGYALQLAVKQEYLVVAISGGDSPEVIARLNKLGVKNVFTQVKNKVEVLQKYLDEHNTEWSKVMFMGDDIPDLEVMLKVGLPCCPADAVCEIKVLSKYISPIKGGEGCGRDIIEKIMRVQQRWVHDTEIRSK